MATSKFPLEEVQQMLNRFEDRLEKRFDKVDEKFEKVDGKIDLMSNQTVKNTLVLDEHIRRTEAAEKRVDLLEQRVDLQRQEVNMSLKAHEDAAVARAVELESRHNDIAGVVNLIRKIPGLSMNALKLLAAASAVGGSLWGLLQLLARYMS